MVSIISAVRDLNRLTEIYGVLAKHGFGEIVQRVSGKPAGQGPDVVSFGTEDGQASTRPNISRPARARLALMDLGPSFVKLGQIASTRTDLLPPEWIVELKKLQNDVRSLPAAEIRAAVESALGSPIEQIFESFDDTPLAAASIGQVHCAVLRHPDGPREVVVKVQRPGIREVIAKDLDLLHMLAKLLEKAIPESRIYGPSALVSQFDTAITSELDFTLEADNARRFRRNFEGNPRVRFPEVFIDASSKQVLTLERLPGGKVYDMIRDHEHRGPTIAKVTVGIVIKMIFEDGFFHADPHPGNILISGTPNDPVIGLVDLGMVGRLSPELREKTIDIMLAAIRQDHVAIADALYQIGTPTRKVEMRAYRAEVTRLSEKYLGKPLKEINLSALISDLVGGATQFGLEIPPDFVLVGKALMTIEGVGKEIDPNLDVLEETKPYFLDLMRKRYSPERLGMELWRGLGQVSGAAYDLPQQTRDILEDLRLGRLTLRVMDAAMPVMVDRLGRRLRASLIVGTFVLSGSWLVGTSAHAVAGYVMVAFGVLVLGAHTAADAVRRWK